MFLISFKLLNKTFQALREKLTSDQELPLPVFQVMLSASTLPMKEHVSLAAELSTIDMSIGDSQGAENQNNIKISTTNFSSITFTRHYA